MKKKRIVVSAVSVLIVLALVVGGTFAWFSDAEKVSADFRTGVLDVELTTNGSDKKADLDFVNLRPMGLDSFVQELTQTPTADNQNSSGYSPNPVYFRRVDVHNVGTLPMQVTFSLADRGPQGDAVTNIAETAQGNMQQTQPDAVCDDTNYLLGKVLQIFVFKNTGTEQKPNWVRVENINLNTETAADATESLYQPFTVGKALAAGESAQFVIGGYLPGETVGNDYQGRHYHGALFVSAGQVDSDEEPPVYHRVSGTVTAPDQVVLEGRKINMRNTETNKSYTLTMKADGSFTGEFPAGNYAIHVAKDSQQKGFYKQFYLEANQSFSIDLVAA